jgi:hypothetical protein
MRHRSLHQWLRDSVGRGKRDEAEQEAVEQEAIPAAENPPAAPHPPETGQGPSDKSPIWTQSMERFAKDEPQLYKLIEDRIGEIRNLDVDYWDTWLNNQPKESENTWLRRCKAYLPQLQTVKSFALRLSNLDPHKIAPLVTTGIFVVVEVGHNCILLSPGSRIT